MNVIGLQFKHFTDFKFLLFGQVIEGAAKILATTLARREKPLYNYVLVPFHDPGKDI